MSGERLARVALSHLVEPGDPRVDRALTELGPEGLLASLRGELTRQGLGAEAATRIADLDPGRLLRSAVESGIRFVAPEDEEWPGGLGDLASREPVSSRGGVPVGLWLRGKGHLAALCRSAVAVVGSRSATTYGAGVAGAMAAEVAGASTTVVSGAAYGIDQAAHRGALATGGPTVAVLACGPDRAYPSAHRDLLDLIAETGVVVSESPPGRSPTKLRFLARNRLLAAMSQGAVVVEAAHRSGALNTANWASRLGRTLMGVPGPVTSAQSEGVHELVRSGAAALVTGGADVLELLAPVGAVSRDRPRGRDRPEDRLGVAERRVLDALPAVRGAGVGRIAMTAGLPEAEVVRCLAVLAASGLAETDGSSWRVVRGDRVDGRGALTLGV